MSKRKYKHSEEFYKKQYQKYVAEVGFENNVFRNEKNPEANFIARYKAAEVSGMKDIRKNMVYQSLYEIDYNTYKAERDIMNKIGKKVKKKDLLSMSTQEFADKYKNEIYNAYKSYQRQGKTKKESMQLISQNFFGSD